MLNQYFDALINSKNVFVWVSYILGILIGSLKDLEKDQPWVLSLRLYSMSKDKSVKI